MTAFVILEACSATVELARLFFTIPPITTTRLAPTFMTCGSTVWTNEKLKYTISPRIITEAALAFINAAPKYGAHIALLQPCMTMMITSDAAAVLTFIQRKQEIPFTTIKETKSFGMVFTYHCLASKSGTLDFITSRCTFGKHCTIYITTPMCPLQKNLRFVQGEKWMPSTTIL